MGRTESVAGILDAAANLKRAGQLREALACYLRALSLRPREAQIHFAIGRLCVRMGRLDQGMASYRQALHFRPDYPEAANNLANALVQAGDHQAAEELYRHALDLRPNFAVAHSNLLLSMHYHKGMDPPGLFAQHRHWARQQAAGLQDAQAAYPNDRSAARPLRIGYVSAGFHAHPVAVFFEPILRTHSRANILTFCYSNVGQPDAVTERLRSLADHWRDVHSHSDDEVVEQIRRDQIDILVDLTGHTKGSRLLVFARKPAPVQATYLGYPNTTGLESVDFRLSDSVADPPGMTEMFHTEKLIRLPRGFLCYRPPAESPGVQDLPATRSRRITFGCFNDRAKITPAVTEAWSKILNAVLESRLLLHFRSPAYSRLNPRTRGNLLEMFRPHGIGEDRVILVGGVAPHSRHLALYRKVDLALDPFPYCGTTTTCEALWMGVPVVSLEGNSHVSRVGASLLRGLGLAEFVATSQEDYVERALRLTSGVRRLRALRLELRSLLENSSLLNASVFTLSLEEAYRAMWRQWLQTTSKRETGACRVAPLVAEIARSSVR
jgi:predicted O-linked N-acetylglucosamine transferase (SPINDLY family)